MPVHVFEVLSKEDEGIYRDFYKICKFKNENPAIFLPKIISNIVYNNAEFLKILADDAQMRDEIISLYKNNYWSVPDIQKKFNVSQKYIMNLLRSANAIRRKCRTPTFNFNFFETIDTESKAYFLGLLSADGNVNEQQQQMRIMLQTEDEYILYKLKEEMGIQTKVYIIKPPVKNPHWKSKSCLEVSSEKLYNDLVNHGITPRKSLTLKYPISIPPNLEHHFIRGLFDGDGCIFVSAKENRNCFSIAGTKDICQGIVDFLKKHDIVIPVRPKGKIYYVETAHREKLFHIRDIIYNNATIYLTRKRKLFYNLNPYIRKMGKDASALKIYFP